MKTRRALPLLLCAVACGPERVDETTWHVEEDGAFTTFDGESTDVDCTALGAIEGTVDGATSVSGPAARLRVEFPPGSADGAELVLGEHDVSVAVETDGVDWHVVAGTVFVETNHNTSADLAVKVRLERVTDDQGRVVEGTLDCLETAGGTVGGAALSACSGGGGGGDHDFDD
jgi:hypothetical protein